MKYLADDGNCEIEVEADSHEEAAQEYVDGGDWGECESTIWIDIRTRLVDSPDDEWEWTTITVDPEEPQCADDGDHHDWQSPVELVGGIEENPGVWGHGGGVVITEVCLDCGLRRITDTWAQDPNTGRQGLESVEYEEPDEEYRALVRRYTEGDAPPECEHDDTQIIDDAEKCYSHCVAPEACNPVAHGGVTGMELCTDCGATRQYNCNGRHTEDGPWTAEEES